MLLLLLLLLLRMILPVDIYPLCICVRGCAVVVSCQKGGSKTMHDGASPSPGSVVWQINKHSGQASYRARRTR